jgi:heme A synthase
VELNDWILALHLLSAALLVGAEVIFGAMIATLWRENSTVRVDSFFRVSQIGTVMVSAGSIGTLVFGLWLSISKDPYDPWDGWIVAALILWAITGGVGTRAGKAYGAAGAEAHRLAAEGTPTSREVGETFGPSQAFKLHVVSNVAILLLLIDMIWKPGA